MSGRDDLLEQMATLELRVGGDAASQTCRVLAHVIRGLLADNGGHGDVRLSAVDRRRGWKLRIDSVVTVVGGTGVK